MLLQSLRFRLTYLFLESLFLSLFRLLLPQAFRLRFAAGTKEFTDLFELSSNITLTPCGGRLSVLKPLARRFQVTLAQKFGASFRVSPGINGQLQVLRCRFSLVVQPLLESTPLP